MALIAGIALQAPPAVAAWLADVELGAFHDDNLTRAQAPADRRPDRALAARASLGQRYLLSGYDTLSVAGEMSAEAYARYPGLDVVSLGAAVGYRRKLRLGLDAPYVSATASAAYASYREDVRDGAKLAVRIELGRRFDESASLVVGASYDRRFADNAVGIVPGLSGAIFDLAGYGVHALADYSPGDRWLVAGRLSGRRGDVESTSQRNPAIFRVSDAVADDPAFRDQALFGYRLRGTTLAGAVAASYAIDDRSSLNAGYVIERTRAREAIEYRNRIVNFAFAHRFGQ